MEDKLYTLKELASIYGINQKTLLKWAKELNFPLIAISPYKRYARETDIKEWEKQRLMHNPTKGI